MDRDDGDFNFNDDQRSPVRGGYDSVPQYTNHGFINQDDRDDYGGPSNNYISSGN